MKFKVGDMVRPTREHLINAIENNVINYLEYINGFQVLKIEDNHVFYYLDKKNAFYKAEHLELVPEEPEFKEGEIIEVSDNGKEWERRIFLYYIPNVPDKYLCVHKNYEGVYLQGGDRYDYQAWLYARKLKPQLTRKEVAEKFGVSKDFTLVD